MTSSTDFLEANPEVYIQQISLESKTSTESRLISNDVHVTNSRNDRTEQSKNGTTREKVCIFK